MMRAEIRGVTLAAPPCPGLARAIGLTVIAEATRAAPAPPPPETVRLTPYEAQALAVLRDQPGPVGLDGLRRSLGCTRPRALRLFAAFGRLVQIGLARATAEQVFAITASGRAWLESSVALTDDDLIAAVRAVNDTPRGGHGYHASACRQSGDPRPPASPSGIVALLVDRNRDPDHIAPMRTRLESLAREGRLIRAAVQRGRGKPLLYYWAPPPGGADPDRRTPCQTPE